MKRFRSVEGDRLAALKVQDGRKIILGTPLRFNVCPYKTRVLSQGLQEV